MGPNILKAEALDNYIMKITLEDGRVALLDMKPYLKKEIYRELNKVEEFKKFEIFYDTIIWSNGADISPEYILEKAV
ncbi:MAG: DUF2442 domain-containing protein [Clostridia bacterium]